MLNLELILVIFNSGAMWWIRVTTNKGKYFVKMLKCLLKVLKLLQKEILKNIKQFVTFWTWLRLNRVFSVWIITARITESVSNLDVRCNSSFTFLAWVHGCKVFNLAQPKTVLWKWRISALLSFFYISFLTVLNSVFA